MIASSSSPSSVVKSYHLWTWLAILFSLVVCATLSYLQIEQSRMLREASSVIRNIGQARLDLNEGVLHLMLAGDTKTPFRSGEGQVLIRQALSVLQQVREQGIAGHDLELEEGHVWGEYEKSVAVFQAEAAKWSHSEPSARDANALRLRVAFHNLEKYASMIDRASQVKLEELNSGLSRKFLLVIGISTVMLCGICAGVYWAGRNETSAVQAMRESEERLRVLSDSLPEGYIFQYVRTADGSERFTYVSAGVERVHGVAPAECLQNPSSLLTLIEPRQAQEYETAVKESARNLTDFELDLCCRHPNGPNRVAHVRSHPVRRPGGETMWYGLVLDITEHQQAQAKIRKNERLLEQMGRTAKVGGWELDPLTGEGEWTEEVARIHELPSGMPPNKELSLSFYEGESRQRLAAALREAIEQGTAYDLELELISISGQHKWVRTIGVPVIENGRVVRVGGSLQDITDLKKAEEATRRQEQNYREIFNSVTDSIFVHDAATGCVIDVNDAMLRMYGFDSKDEFLSGDARFLIFDAPPYSAREMVERIREAAGKGPQIFEWRSRRKSGEPFWVEVSLRGAEIDGKGRVLASVRDITLRKRSELEIERLTRLYSTLSEVNQTIVRCQSRDKLFDEICRIMVEFGKFQAAWVGLKNSGEGDLHTVAQHWAGGCLTGAKPDWHCIRTVTALLRTEQPALCDRPEPGCEDCCLELLPGMEIQSCATFPLRLGDGMVGAFSLFSGEPGFFNAEEVRLLNEIAADISFAMDRMHEQEQQRIVQEERMRLTTAMEQAAELIVITDIKGNILYVNPAFERVTGYLRKEALGKNPRILKSGRQDTEFYRILWETLEHGDVWHGRMVNRKKNGDFYEEDATISPIRNHAGEVVNYVAVKHDVTREVELESQFRQAQKLEGIGQLAGGVAHDFNNILAAIMLQAQVSENTPGVPAAAAEGMHHIQQCCERGANLTRQLLLFGRKQEMQTRDVDLNEVVNNITQMLRRIIRESVGIHLDLCPQPLIAHGDPGMLDQVVMNLAINGRDAMDGHGQLTIGTSLRTVDQKMAGLNPDGAPGNFACLSISDTGCGIAPEVLPRIFDPFFTTKERGKGTGLGLATVFGIIKQHKGWIQVKTEEGKGTTFDVYLPLGKTGAKTPSEVAATDAATKGNETILLAEDDSDVRKITKTFLELQGYRVLEACDGVEALAVWDQSGGKVDLLLTDLLMPNGVNGHELAQRIHAKNPELKVIYFSGYSEDLAGQGLDLRPGENFLQKPVIPNQLLSLIRFQFASGKPGGNSPSVAL